MPVAWHPDRWWDWCMSEDEKKQRDPVFVVPVLYNWGEKIVYVFQYIHTKIYTCNCLKKFSACYIIQTNSVSILFMNYMYIEKYWNSLIYKPKIC